MADFNYLVRFEDQKGDVHYGEISAEDARSDLVGKSLNIYEGVSPWNKNFCLSKD